MKPTLALILLATLAGTAAAQGPTPEPVPGVTPTEPVPEQPPQPPQPPHPQPPPSGGGAADPGGGGAMGGETGRPEGIAFGIGFGYSLPTSVQTPNTTSVRMRLAGGLTFEPIIVLGNESTKQETGGVSSKDSKSELSLGVLGRLPMVRHGKFELELLAGVGFGTIKDDPDGNDNNTTTSTVNLNWGLAVSYWVTRHWNVSFSARNPLVSISKVSREMAAGTVDTTTTTFAVEFAPIVSVMLHLYN
jgi:hypothetical protein